MTLPRRMQRTLREINGVQTAWHECAAENDALCVLALHSLGLDGASFRALAESSTGVRWIAFDQRGHGQACDAPDLTLDRLVADAIAAVQASGASRVHLLGHSLGGAVAALAASRLAGRCASLTLLATPPGGGEIFTERARQVQAGAIEEVRQQTLQRWFGAELDRPASAADAQAQAYAREALATLDRAHCAAAWQALAAFPGYELLAASLPPTLAVAGRADLSTPPALMQRIAQAYAKAGAQGRYAAHEIEEGHHMFALTPSPELQVRLLAHWRANP